VIVFFNPARLWDQQREELIALAERFNEVRDLDTLITTLKDTQGECLGLMRRVHFEGEDTVPNEEFKKWNHAAGKAVREAGPQFESRYTNMIAQMAQAC
jgi:hypothetical protein